MIDTITKRIVGLEHLHRHSEYSLLDGMAKIQEYAEYSKKANQKYLCITDHGMMAAVPDQIRECNANDLHPIFGIEFYLNNDHPPKDIFEKMSAEEKKKIRKSYHLLAIAFNTTGFRNLVQLSSWAWTNGYYYKPRVTHEQLLKHKEGIIFSSCCYLGEIGQAFDKGGEEAGFAMIEKYMAMFGNNFYLELMLLDFKKQKPFDAFIIKAHDKYHIPLIITQDCHYCYKEDSKFQRYMLMIQKKKTLQSIEALSPEEKEDAFELQDTNLWMKTEEELNEKWAEMYSDVIPYELFVQSKLNTVKICEKAKGVELDRTPKLPTIPDAEEKLKEAILIGAKRRGITTKKKYLERIKEEYELICRKGYASYFLIQKQIIDEAKRVTPLIMGNEYDPNDAVGCGRGSAVASLVLFCLGVTDVDPMRHDLLFSRFMSESRGGRTMRLKFSK